MIILFGPAGAGKTVQGQLLAKNNGWKWLSVGQILRNSHNSEIIDMMSKGKLASTKIVDEIIEDAIIESGKIGKVIIDGFPREINQAKWLVDFCRKKDRRISLVLVFDVPNNEIMRRLLIRARIDDLPDSINERLRIYHEQVNPILKFFGENNIPIAHINGVGSISEINERINKKLVEEKIL